MKPTISAVISTYNEEENLKACLESLEFADEIVVVDDGSTDKTVSIAKKYTEHVYHHKSVGYVEPARNSAISKAKGDWVLVVDADESIPPTLAEKLRAVCNDAESSLTHVLIPRKNIIFTKWIRHSGWWPDYQIRFFKKGSVVWSDAIHSKPETAGEGLELEPRDEFAIIHNNYKSVSAFIKLLDRYTDQEAEEKHAVPIDLLSLVRKPGEESLSRFFARKGYEDGLHGYVLSELERFYTLVYLAKVWEKDGFTDHMSETFLQELYRYEKQQQYEREYWYLTTFLETTDNPFRKLLYKIRRAFVQSKLSK